MSPHDEASLLSGVPPFKTLDTARLKLLAFASDRLSYEIGRDLVTQGDAGDAVFVVLEGEIEVSIASKDGPRVLRRMGRHAFIGEIAVMKEVSRTATVRAVTPVVALRIERDTLLRVIQDVPALGEAIREHMAKSDYVFD